MSSGQDSSTWSQKRRFTLSNGEVVWDISGNVSEVTDWTTGGDTLSLGPNTCPSDEIQSRYQLTEFECSDLNSNDYLPGNPAQIPPREYISTFYYLGVIVGTPPQRRANGEGGVAQRSGSNGMGSVGIFTMNLSYGVEYVASKVGFRCVCLVGAVMA